jgi:hypothetical protein
MTVRTLGRIGRVVIAVFGLVSLVLVCTIVLAAPTLAGQLRDAGGQKAPSGFITFGIQPSGPTQPDKRSWFIYRLNPGTTIEDWVAVENFSVTPLRINLYARDAVETAGGGFTVQLFAQRPVGVGTWIHLPETSVVVDPDKAAIVPFTIAVPPNATPGDHAGGIVASITREAINKKGARIQIEQRVGVRVYARIAGALRPKLIITGLVSHYTGVWSAFAGGTLTVTYTLRNVGNLDLSAPTLLRLTNPFGWSRTLPPNGRPPDLLPGTSISVTRLIRGVYPAFRVDTKVTVQPGFSAVSTASGLNQTSLHLGDVSASTGTWAIPWPLIVLIVLILLLGTYFYLRYRRRRAARGNTADPS